MVWLLIPATVAIFWSLFLCIAGFIVSDLKYRRTQCTHQVVATVTGIHASITGGGTHGSRIQTPIYTYTYDGEEFNIVGNYTLKRGVGDIVTLFIDPDNPSVLLDPAINVRTFALPFRIAGWCCVVGSIIVGIFMLLVAI